MKHGDYETFVCDNCSFKTKRKDNMYRHQRSKHSSLQIVSSIINAIFAQLGAGADEAVHEKADSVVALRDEIVRDEEEPVEEIRVGIARKKAAMEDENEEDVEDEGLSLEEGRVEDADDDIYPYERMRNLRVALLEAEFKLQCPDFDKEVEELKMKMRVQKKIGARGKRKMIPTSFVARRSSRRSSGDCVLGPESSVTNNGEDEDETGGSESEVYADLVEDAGVPDIQADVDASEGQLDAEVIDGVSDGQGDVGSQHIQTEDAGSQQDAGVPEHCDQAGDIVHEAVGKFGCIPCDMSFRDVANMRRHVKLMHEPRLDPVRCPRTWCKAEFTNMVEMISHRRNCFLVCPAPGCFKTFQKEFHFATHQRYHKAMAKRMKD